MKRNALTLVVGVILLIIFFLLLFTFQVRQTEMVVLTTFAKPSAKPIDEPGLYFKWPLPIQRVHRFDKRIHNFEDEFEQMLTRDGHNILASLYVGWTIDKPLEFFNSFAGGKASVAEPQLKSLVRSTKQAVIGQRPFADFISSDPQQAKFNEIEQQILQQIRKSALDKYGVDIRFVGVKRLGLPESVTQKVFDRMTAERQSEVDRLQAEGEKEANIVRSAANRDRDQILARARAEATRITGEAESEASRHFETLNQNTDLAIYLLQLQALERTLSKGATLVVDPRTVPFHLLTAEALQAPQTNNRTNQVQTRGPSLSSTEPGNTTPSQP